MEQRAGKNSSNLMAVTHCDPSIADRSSQAGVAHCRPGGGLTLFGVDGVRVLEAALKAQRWFHQQAD